MGLVLRSAGKSVGDGVPSRGADVCDNVITHSLLEPGAGRIVSVRVPDLLGRREISIGAVVGRDEASEILELLRVVLWSSPEAFYFHVVFVEMDPFLDVGL